MVKNHPIGPDLDGGSHVPLDKFHRCWNRLGKRHPEFGLVHDFGFVEAREPPRLNPGIGKMGQAVPSEEQDTAHGGYTASLIRGA